MSPFSSKATGLKPATLTKKSPPPTGIIMAASIANTEGNLTFHWSKEK